MKELGVKTGVILRLDPPLTFGELKQGCDPHIGATVSVRGETFKAENETADLWQPKWNRESDSHTYPRQERWPPGMCSGRELEFRDCGAIPG